MRQSGTPTTVIAASLGLACFAASILAGLAVDNPADEVLTRALACLAAGWAIGFVLGALLEHAFTQRSAALAAAKVNPPASPENNEPRGAARVSTI